MLKQAKENAGKICQDKTRTWKPQEDSLCDMIAALSPAEKTAPTAPRLSDALRHLDPDDLQDVRAIVALTKTP